MVSIVKQKTHLTRSFHSLVNGGSESPKSFIVSDNAD